MVVWIPFQVPALAMTSGMVHIVSNVQVDVLAFNLFVNSVTPLIVTDKELSTVQEDVNVIRSQSGKVCTAKNVKIHGVVISVSTRIFPTVLIMGTRRQEMDHAFVFITGAVRNVMNVVTATLGRTANIQTCRTARDTA